MGRRKRKRRSQENIELNLAAMLDMAFQLLTFFILTFKPSPVEGQINLRMPPPQSITPIPGGQKAGQDTENPDPLQGLKTLVIDAISAKDGSIGTLRIGQTLVPNIEALEKRMHEIFSSDTSPYDQVLIQVDSHLTYAGLMNVVDVCTRQEINDNGERKPLSKLSFVELGTAE